MPLARFVAACSLLSLVLPQVPQATTPTWAKPDRFWYRRAVSGGNVWLTVDTTYGVRQPLFDHQRLAIELNLKANTNYTRLTLPFADPAAAFAVKYDGSNDHTQTALALEFVLGGQQWRCDLEVEWDWGKVPPTDYECSEKGPASTDPQPAVTAQPVPSPDGRWEALVQNNNVAIRPLQPNTGAPKTLSTDGTATQAYQQDSIQWSADGTKVTAYRVSEEIWTSDNLGGNVKSLIAKGEWPVR